MALALNCGIPSTPQGRELVQHGSTLFPIACYEERLTCYSVPWHWHEDFEYILAHAGTVTIGVDKKRICLTEGEGVFINSGVLHAVEFAENGPSVLRSGVFHPRLVGGIDTIYWQKLIRPLQHPGAPAYFLLSETVPWQAEVLARLWESWHAVNEEPEDYENRVRYLLSAALHTITTHCPTEECCVSRQEQVAARRMKRMLRFVEEHYAEELTVKCIADSAALSESACLRSFRQLLGTTPIQYVKQYRIEKAAELLLATRLRTGEIGAECGFTDLSYFTRTFREIKHCTPKAYRQRFAPQGEKTIPDSAADPAAADLQREKRS